MYKVFVNEKPLFLTNTFEKETNFKIYLLETVNIPKVISELFLNKIQSAYLYHSDEKLIMKTLKSKIPVAKAGGGLVFNANGEVLFIFRNGKWDLPKGGIEKDETIENAAMREVEEETGVSGLKITEKLQKTYHVFKRNGIFKSKITYWFKMETNYTGPTCPQDDCNVCSVKLNNGLLSTLSTLKFLFQTCLRGLYILSQTVSTNNM